MNAFRDGQSIEGKSMAILIPFLELKCPGHQLIWTDSQLYLQKFYGDAVLLWKDKSRLIEFKAEENASPNMFLESWSNKPEATPGWLQLSRAETLWYHFINSDELYSMNMQELKHWALDKDNVRRFPERCQARHSQKNQTWGWCVPINEISRSVRSFVFFKPKEAINLVAVNG